MEASDDKKRGKAEVAADSNLYPARARVELVDSGKKCSLANSRLLGCFGLILLKKLFVGRGLGAGALPVGAVVGESVTRYN